MAGKVIEWEILKRTFEGKNDPSKNNHALTSKYMPSKKYIAIYKVQFDHGGIAEVKDCYTTKKEALDDMEFKCRYGYGS